MDLMKTDVWSRSNVWCRCEKNTWTHIISDKIYSEGRTGEILADFLSKFLSDDKNEYEFFTQDGAPAHQSNILITMLR